jgi:glycine cleavage system H lipoate-binding protein
MRCPFLREAQVKSCCASTFRKMIVRTSDQATHERCSSSDWVSCPTSKQHCEDHPSAERCPFLLESLVQYCSAAPLSKFVPYSDGPASHCTSDGHKYCDLYLSVSKEKSSRNSTSNRLTSGVPHSSADDLSAPEELAFTPNHMWIDVADDRTCHIGVDALLAKALGKVDGLSFVTTKGTAYPTLALNVHGVDLVMVFPNQMLITGLNTYLRSRPSTLTSRPYTLGWLFEGAELRSQDGRVSQQLDHGCLRGKQVHKWMSAEADRITTYVHEQLVPGRHKELVTMLDGGIFVEGLVNHLTRDETLQFFNEFFSPAAQWRFTT